MTQNILKNILDLDLTTPLFRIARVDHLIGDITNGIATLPRVIGWDDPHEAAFFTRRVLMHSGERIGLSELAIDWFGQCWSTKPESDAMWRIYNRCGNAIRIETTAKDLLQAFYSKAIAVRPAFEKWASLSLFLGKVQYLDAASMSDLMMTPVTSVMTPNAEGIARMLVQKRDAFDHENEVRLLYQSLKGDAYAEDQLDDTALLQPEIASYRIDGVNQSMPRFIRVPFEWSSIKSAMIGPLVEETTALSIEERLQSSAPWIKLSRSNLYGPPRYDGQY